MSGPRLLALDTATEQMALAVVAGERIWCAQEAGGALASQRLLPLALRFLLLPAGQLAQLFHQRVDLLIRLLLLRALKLML